MILLVCAALWVSGAKTSRITESSDLNAGRNRRGKLVQLPRVTDEVVRDPRAGQGHALRSGSGRERVGSGGQRCVPGLSLVGCGTSGGSPNLLVPECRGLYLSFWHGSFLMLPSFSLYDMLFL